MRETTLKSIFAETRSRVRPQPTRFAETSNPAHLKESVVSQLEARSFAISIENGQRVPAAVWRARHDVGSAKPALLQTARDAAQGRLLTLLAGLFAAGTLVFTALNFNLSRRTFDLAERDLDAARAELARARQEPGEAETRAAGRRRRGGPRADAEGDAPERSRETGPVAFLIAFLKDNAQALGAAAAALGGVLYVLLTWITSWVYQPAGVRSSDVGLVVAGVTVFVWNGASQARRDILDAASSVPIGVNNPWEGEIANVQRIGSTSTTVTCGLYLGESNGTGVLVYNESTGQFKHIRTLRLPLSSVLIEIMPDQVVC